jgi:hypothetical protein
MYKAVVSGFTMEVIENQLRDFLKAGITVEPFIANKDYADNIEKIRQKCLEFSGESGKGRAAPDFGSWRRGGHQDGGARFNKQDAFQKSKQSVVVPLNTAASSTTKSAWSSGPKKDVEQGSAPASASVPAQAQAPAPAQTNIYKLPSQQKAAGFNKSKEEVEANILNNLILSKLNKFTAENYENIKQFMEQILNNDETTFLKDFMILVFKKATYEPLFCPLYVKLIAELSAQYPIIKAEVMTLYHTYVKEFENVEEENVNDENYDDFCASQKVKLYRLGYGQFLGELTKYQILDGESLLKLYNTILDTILISSLPGMSHRNQVEQMTACLSRITSVFKKEKNPALISICKVVSSGCSHKVKDILRKVRAGELPGISNKARFSLMDCEEIFDAL